MVGDRAMLNDKIIVEYHRRNDMDYLGVLKTTKDMKSKIAEINHDNYELIDTEKDHGLYSGYLTTWKFSYEGKSYTDRILIVRSEKKVCRDIKSREKQIKKVKENLVDLKEKLNKTIYKKKDKVEERIKSMLSGKRGTNYFKIEVKENEDKTLELNWSLDENKIAEDKLLDGKYIIATNRMGLSPEAMLKTYKKRDISEKDFELLKCTLGLRTIFLHKDNRIESLIFFTMCALLIYSIIKFLLKEAKITLSVNKTLNKFETFSVAYYTFIDGSVEKVMDDLDHNQTEILGKLKLGDLTEYVKFNL